MKSIEERREELQGILKEGFRMLMQDPVREGSLQNRVIEGCCTSYQFQLNTLSYRGSWISTIEDIQVSVDGEEVPRDNMMFFCNGNNYPIADMCDHTENFWGARDDGIVRIYKVGGLSKGEHTLDVTVVKRNDFGHSIGDGYEGYAEADEFHNPFVMHQTLTCTVE